VKPNILAICGSTKQSSINLSLIKAIADLTAAEFNLSIFSSIESIPHFNPDKDNDSPPPEVSGFRNRIKNSDGVLICTPEYAMGVPGTLKNAIDWTVSSGEFSHKPVALITASSQGQKGHASLLETLRIIECSIPDETQMVISFVKTKVSSDNKIIDPATLESVKNLMTAFSGKIRKT